MNVFAKRLHAARKKKNWTQTQLAKELSIRQAYVSNYETGKDEPSDELKGRIAELLGVSLDYLEGRTPDAALDLSNPDVSNTLAHRLKVIRNYYHKSQADFAKELGIAQSTLSSFESGTTTPSFEILQQIGRMGFDVNWLLYGENNQPETDKIILDESEVALELARIQELLRQLPKDKISMWRQILELYIANEMP